jgi:hypothetical protein
MRTVCERLSLRFFSRACRLEDGEGVSTQTVAEGKHVRSHDGNIACDNSLSEALNDGSLSDTRLQTTRSRIRRGPDHEWRELMFSLSPWW